jgi:hypothetical protein
MGGVPDADFIEESPERPVRRTPARGAKTRRPSCEPIPLVGYLGMKRVIPPLILLMGLMLMYDGYSLGARKLTLLQSGIASWYGERQPTADGEKFNPHDFTAASRHLPFNTVVKVTNEKNGRSVDVRINDRGPYVKGRVLDLSEAAAKSLDIKDSGTAPVKIEMEQPPPSAEAAPSP